MEPTVAKEMEKDEVKDLDDDGKAIDSWRIDSAITTLQEAEEIKRNKKLMKALKPKLAKKKKAIESLSDLMGVRDRLRKEGK